MLGYFFFFLTAVFYTGLAVLTAAKPSLSGENAMGYGLSLFFWAIGFAVGGLLLTISILYKNGFDWVAPDAGIRTVLMLFSWLLIALTILFCALFKWEWPTDTSYPQFLHWLAVRHGQLWIPLLWLVACFLSLDKSWQSTLSPQLFNIPFWVGLAISTVFCGGLIVGYMRDSAKSYQAELASQIEQQDQFHSQALTEIAAHQSTDPIIQLLIYTIRNQSADIREAALAKIKAHPTWEADLLALLKDNQSYREVYYFLDGNQVEHPQQFAEPLNQSIGWLSATIKRDIEDSNNLQHWSFDMYGIELLLNAIDGQFQGLGVDYYPNVVNLKQALNTTPPERFKDVHFTATDVVEGWLKKHKK